MRKTIKTTVFLLCISICLILSSKITYAANDDIYDPEYYTHNSSEVFTYSNDVASSEIEKYDHGDKAGNKISLCVDVSKWNGNVDWEKAKKAGVDAAFVRIGHSMLKDGEITLDPYYEKNLKGAQDAGIRAGVYYYSQATNAEEALEEVNFIIETLDNVQLELPVVYDAECGTYKENGIVYDGKLKKSDTSKSAKKWSAVARVFCDAIAEAGYTPMIYGSISKLNSTMGGVELSEDYQIWIARYNHTGKVLNDSKHSFKGDYQVWQYTDLGQVDGIGKCDLNFIYEKNSQEITASNVVKEYTNKAFSLGAKLTSGDGELTYESSDTSVVTVNSKGKVTPKKVGKAQITITAAETNDYIEETKTVTVNITKATQEIIAADITKPYNTKAFLLDAELSKGNGKLTYKSSDTKVATVSLKGKITPKKIGKTKITITASETKSYKTKSITITVTIKPTTPSIATLKNSSSKAMKLTWKKDSKATGYTVRYSTSKSMKNAKSISIKKNSTTSQTIKKLSKNKTYYVQIQSNHKSTGLKSSWSKVKSVKIKK